MGAAQSHLDKLDKVQHSAEKIGDFTVEPLQARRDAAAMSFALKLLDGKARGELKNFIPIVTEPLRLCKKRTRQSLEGTQILPTVRAKSLDVYKKSFRGVLPRIWARIPQEIISKGANKGTKRCWLKIKTKCVDFLIGKQKPNIHTKQKAAEKQPETCSTKLNNELNGYV